MLIVPGLSASSFMYPFIGPVMPSRKAKVRIIYAYPDPAYPIWPNIHYDFDGHIKQIKQTLDAGCPDIELLSTSTMLGTAEEGKRILALDAEADGYVIYLAGCLWGDLTETIAASGKPTIIADNLFAGSGEFLTSYAAVKRLGYPVLAVSSSDPRDLVDAVNCFSCIGKLKDSTILVVGGDIDASIEKIYGTRVVQVKFEEINDIYANIKQKDANEVADKWISESAKVIEPAREEIVKAAAIYLSMIKLMTDHNAQAITINCLGGIYSNQMVEAYPCLGFMQLDNDGYVGACEADQRSTMTKLLMTYLTGRPGYISDPVIDTSKNQIIYAHCVAPTRMFGPKGPANPYHIRNHSEDRKGACNRSLFPLGEMTTTLEFDHLKKQVIFHQGVTVENVDEDKACRTKLAVEIKGDIQKLFNYWDQWSWHRVTFFGDLKKPVYNIAALMGFEVVQEA
jgi:L-fucose isomerase-like protein